MTQTVLQKLKKFYITMLQAQKYRAQRRIAMYKNRAGYVS